MNTTTSYHPQDLTRLRTAAFEQFGVLLLILWFVASARAQGTMTITFEGLARGIHKQADVYSESGLQFGNLTPQSDYLSGGGIPDYPDNGTGYLEIPAGTLRFGFHEFPPTFPLTLFNLVSFDAAEWWVGSVQTLTVVGYHPMAGTVTNTFILDGINDGTGPLQDFQTFHLDSSFQNVFRVDVLNASWSLDNVVVSGVPEPSTGALMVLGAACLFWFMRVGRRRHA